MERLLIRSGSPWEDTVGFSRAVRIGQHIWVAGTAPVDGKGEPIAPGDAYGQTVAVLEKIKTALDGAGAKLEHVVRTRIFVSDMSVEAEVGRAHREFFEGIRPAATMVAISGLVRPELLVEIEADAFVHDQEL